MKLTHIASAIAFLAASIAGPSFAQGNNDTVGLYGGASVGPSRGEIDDRASAPAWSATVLLSTA